MLLAAVLATMTADNAIRVFRELRGQIKPYSTEEGQLLAHLESLGYFVTTAEVDRRFNAKVATIKRCEERLTFVHPRRSKIYIEEGSRVIVPARPMGRHLGGSRRQKQLVYLYDLEPVQVIRRSV